MSNLTVKFDVDSVIKALGRLQDEAPYALSQAINNTMVDVQTAEIAHINDVFTIRRQAFLKRSVKITKFAKKTDLTGTIQIADVGAKKTSDIFSKFETGKNKTATQGRNVAIPTSQVRPSKSGVIPSSRRPSNLPRSFKLTTDGGNSFIVQAKKRKGKDDLTFMYTLKPFVRIDARLGFVRTGMDTIMKVGERNLEAAVIKALQSSKFQ